MKWILDTDILTLFQQGHPAVLRRCSQVAAALAVTVISVEEQLSGWYKELRKAKSPERLAWAYGRLTSNVSFLAQLTIHSFDVLCIQRFDSLSKLKTKLGVMDLRIAAITLEQNAILVTRNVRDFQRIPQLRVEDWST